MQSTNIAGPCKILKSWTGSSMVEQLTLNQRVAGSSPARFTKYFQRLSLFWFSAQKELCSILCPPCVKLCAAKIFYCVTLRFIPDMRISLHHFARDVSG